jgi:hypothetical protein
LIRAFDDGIVVVMSILRFVAREKPQTYPAENVDERLGRIERTLADIAERMATKADLDEVRRALPTKVELESVRDDIRKIADGYAIVIQRIDHVAELLKTHLIMPR